MSVEVELGTNAVGDLRCLRITLSRVPAVGEMVRILATLDGGTKAFLFRVTKVVHTANTREYPKRQNEVDAWIDAIAERADR